MRTLTKILLPLCLLFIFVAAASAQPGTASEAWTNPDHTSLGTPDGVPPSGETICAGQVGAAHGLCTAYCEAMDCDSANPQASPTACSKVRENYVKHTGQAPPCDCPCMTQFPGFADALNGPVLSCQRVGPFPGVDFTFLVTPSGFFPGSGQVGRFQCGNVNDGALGITAEQNAACLGLIKQKAAAAGVTCP
jgi:hypothetical protein